MCDSRDVEQTMFYYEELIRNYHKQPLSQTASYASLPTVWDTSPNQVINEHRFGSYDAIIANVRIVQSNKITEIIRCGGTIRLEIEIYSKHNFESVVLGLSLRDKAGIEFWGDNTLNAMKDPLRLKEGTNILAMEVNSNFAQGEYFLLAGIADISHERIELDQRWPVAKLAFISTRPVGIGYVYSPLMILECL